MTYTFIKLVVGPTMITLVVILVTLETHYHSGQKQCLQVEYMTSRHENTVTMKV